MARILQKMESDYIMKIRDLSDDPSNFVQHETKIIMPVLCDCGNQYKSRINSDGIAVCHVCRTPQETQNELE